MSGRPWPGTPRWWTCIVSRLHGSKGPDAGCMTRMKLMVKVKSEDDEPNRESDLGHNQGAANHYCSG